MPAVSASLDRRGPCAFRDGLGERFVSLEHSGAVVQMLHLPPALAGEPALELVLRERTTRLASFRNPSYLRVHRIDRVDAPPALVLVSEYVEGIRLSELLLRITQGRHVDLDISTALWIIRQVLRSTAVLHQHAPDIANGLIAPERLIITPHARVVIAEQALSAVVEHLRYNSDRLWRELRIAMPAGMSPRFTPRTDVLNIGLTALALALGRPLDNDDFPARVAELLDSARERSTLGYQRPVSPPLRDWMARTLQLESDRSFASPWEAWLEFEKVIAADPLYLSSPIAVEMFLYSCTAVLIQPPGASEPTQPQTPANAPASETPRQTPATDPTTTVVGSLPPPALPLPSPSSLSSVLTDREIQASMEPAPSSVDTHGSSPETDAIDWTAIATQPATVATSGEITQLFSDAEAPSFEDRPAERQPPPPPAPAAVTLWGPGAGDPFSRASTGAASSSQVDAAEQPGFDQSRRLRVLAGWRRIGIAAALAAAIGAGTMATRFLRPEIVAASEMGTLVVESIPAGLPVLVDRVERGVTPARLPVAVGEHVLEVRGQSSNWQGAIQVAGGSTLSQYVEFAASPQPGAPPPGEPEAAGNGQPDAGATPKMPAAVATVAADTPPPAWGWLTVKSPAPAEIRLGGRVVGSTQRERIRMAPGRHEIDVVNAADGSSVRRVVYVEAGRTTRLNLNPPTTGMVNVNASPWAEVWIGGRRVGETPLANVSVPVGSHEVVFRHPQLGEKRQGISVTSGAPVRLSMEMR